MSAAEALAPERSVDEVRESLSVTEKGQPANTIGNCRTVFCHDPLLRGAIRLNLLTDRVDIVQDLGWRRNTSALTDTDVKYLLLYFEQTYGLTSEKKMTAALSIVANENCYHPIQDVLNGLVWDGTPRIRSCLHHFLGADESDYVEEMLKHFLLGAIRRVFRPGSKYEEMLCLVGGQGAGKSSFFRLLAIRDEWFSDDLKKLDDDRVYLKLQGHWIIEMSEMLATSSAKSIEEIRSFISRQKETYRTPYEAQPKDRLRQCAFAKAHNVHKIALELHPGFCVYNTEQVGRLGCFGFMIINIPGTWFGWWSDEAFGSIPKFVYKSLIDHVHFFFAVFVFEIHIFAANDRRKLCKIIRNRPVQCDIGKRCLCSPTAWCIHAINERFNTFLNFRITQVVHLDKRCQIRIKRRKCLRTSPFILHDSKEIHHLITKDTQVLCRCGCNLTFDATQPFFDKLFQ